MAWTMLVNSVVLPAAQPAVIGESEQLSVLGALAAGVAGAIATVIWLAALGFGAAGLRRARLDTLWRFTYVVMALAIRAAQRLI